MTPRRRGFRPGEGFTLIELMIVVAIIGILAAIAIPRFADMIRKSNEGKTKGNLAMLRSAISIYYGDLEGQYPTDLTSMTISGKYMDAIPTAQVPPYHSDSSSINYGMWGAFSDAGGWQYNNVTNAPNLGTIWINCDHTDTKGSVWSDY